jgi:triacylglycerol esterase/lipase EstA (alpha/beta hydrolase family)
VRHRAGWIVIAGLWVASAGGGALGAPLGTGPLGGQTDVPPEQVAQGHLRRACDLVATSVDLEKKCDVHAVDGFYAACEEAWNAVWICPGSYEILCEASGVYAEALQGLLESACRHGRVNGDGLWVGPKWRPVCVPIEVRGLFVGEHGIESIEAACRPADGRITRRHVRGGFGLPVAVRLAAGPPGSVARDFAPPRQSIAATAVLRFKMPGGENRLQKFSGTLARDHAPAILDLANPIEIAAVNIGCAKPMLAADLTSPMLDMLACMPKAGAIQGFVQPFGGGDTQPRLEFLEPHQRGRIPVVFIHGLASDEGTWFDMLNELRAWPTFHRRFEAWLYHYPTGASFLQSAAVLRRELADAVQRLDPAGSEPALQSLVLVGHSMGGLHAKLQVVDSGTTIWGAVACRPFEQIAMRPEIRRQVAPAYFFRPQPFVKRVVFIATPHRGSILASLGVGRVASLTVRQPAESVAIHTEVVQANPGAFREDYERQLPTTVDVLAPDSMILNALLGLRPPCWVTTHSIIGNGHKSSLCGDGDCIVPVSSAQLPGVVSELCVPAKHVRVHHHPRSIAELQRILVQHLHETGL